MNAKPVIIDCDPGVDDAIAILLAKQLPELNILGITTVAGNVGVETTTYNALCLAELVGLDVPVHKGAALPIFRDQVDASNIHGSDGMGGIKLPTPRNTAAELPAWDFIYQQALAYPGELELIAVGPLTNLGLAFMKYEDLHTLIKRIVVMGGSATAGNASPAAEFNFFADPEAADMVFTSGVPVYMCGLDVTEKAFFTPEEVASVANFGSTQAKFFSEVLVNVVNFCLAHGMKGMAMHDPVAMLYAADDSMFETHHVWIRVETKGGLTKGKSVTDLYSDRQYDSNAYIVTHVEREPFRDRVMQLMAAY